MRYAAAALAALLAAAPAHARPPEVVPWSDAAAHVGSIVTVEGTVARARVENGACTMEFAPDDPAAFRVVLMLALFQSPTDPERLYSGRRVRASGRVQTYQGRPEMIIRRADQIEILDAPPTTTTLAPSPPPPAAVAPMPSTSTVPAPTVPPTRMPRPAPTAAPSTPAPASGSTPVPTTAPAPAPSPVAPVPTQRCAEARARLEAARRELSTRSEDAARCLREGSSRCEREREAVARALEALPARETEADSACE